MLINLEDKMAGSRQEIQSYLAGSRAEMETLLTDSISQILQPRPGTNLTAQAIYWQRRTVELHREFMVSIYTFPKILNSQDNHRTSQNTC